MAGSVPDENPFLGLQSFLSPQAEKGTEPSGISSYKDTNLVGPRPHSYDLI